MGAEFVPSTFADLDGLAAQSQVSGLVADLAARPTAAGNATITGAWTFESTVTTSIAGANPILVAWQNPNATSNNNGLWQWIIGEAGDYDGELKLTNGSTQYHFTDTGIYWTGNQYIGLGNGGAIQDYTNAVTNITLSSGYGWTIGSATRTYFQIDYTTHAALTASAFYTTGVPLWVNQTAAGSAAAQFEVTAKDGSTPILAGYAYTGAAVFEVGPTGNVTTVGGGNAYTDKLIAFKNASGTALLTLTGDGRLFVGADDGTNANLVVNGTIQNNGTAIFSRPATGFASAAIAVQDLAVSGSSTLNILGGTGRMILRLVGSSGRITLGNDSISDQQFSLDTSTGDVSLSGPIGVNGATPPAKAASPGTAAGTDAAVINAIVTILRNLGVCS